MARNLKIGFNLAIKHRSRNQFRQPLQVDIVISKLRFCVARLSELSLVAPLTPDSESQAT